MGAKLRRAIGIVGILFMAQGLSAARFPNSVPQTFSVEGAKAQAWLKVLGIDPIVPTHLSLALHQNEVHARKIRMGDPANVTSVSNQISWDPKTQILSLSGDWLDQTTGSFRHLPHYTFGSPFIPLNLSDAGNWRELLKKLGFPRIEHEKKKSGTMVEQRVSGSTRPSLSVTIYRAENFDPSAKYPQGYQVTIGIQDK